MGVFDIDGSFGVRLGQKIEMNADWLDPQRILDRELWELCCDFRDQRERKQDVDIHLVRVIALTPCLYAVLDLVICLTLFAGLSFASTWTFAFSILLDAFDLNLGPSSS
jgi:hypothetical protein